MTVLLCRYGKMLLGLILILLKLTMRGTTVTACSDTAIVLYCCYGLDVLSFGLYANISNISVKL